MAVSNKSRPKVRLVLKQLTFVRNEQEAASGPNEQVLLVDQEVLQRAVGYAESQKWRNPDRSIKLRHLPRPAVLTFVKALREALGADPTASSGPKGRMSARDGFRDYFEVPVNRRQLVRVLDFLQNGGELSVEAA